MSMGWQNLLGAIEKNKVFITLTKILPTPFTDATISGTLGHIFE